MEKSMYRFPWRRVCLLAILAMVYLVGGLDTAAESADFVDWIFIPADPARPAVLPDGAGTFPVELVIDDSTVEGDFGIGAMTADQFLWFNRFTPTETNFELVEIDVLFPMTPNLPVGGDIQLLVYHDPDGDPTNGADLLASYDEVVQVADGVTFSSYPLTPGVEIRQGGDILVGVVSRFVESGVSLPVSPAALDTTASQGRSWVATWIGDPPPDAPLPPDGVLILIDDLLPGNFMIRAFGVRLPVVEVPTLNQVGLILFGTLLLLSALPFLARRRARVKAASELDRG